MRSVPVFILCSVLLAGCIGRSQAVRDTRPALRVSCAASDVWDGSACRERGGVSELERGTAALGEFRVEEALTHLQTALQRGPHLHRQYASIYEHLGIAYAYLGREDQALASFDMLLSLRPEHLLSYTLSPKATFVFENARKQVAERARAELQISWPYELDVSRPVPIDIAVIADPKGFLKTAELLVRRKGEDGFSALDVTLPAAGSHTRVTLPALSSQRSEVLEVYAQAHDGDGNQVLLWASKERPRELVLGYTPPVPWYRKWWIWASVGTAVAMATGTAVYALTREPPDTVGGTLVFRRGGRP